MQSPKGNQSTTSLCEKVLKENAHPTKHLTATLMKVFRKEKEAWRKSNTQKLETTIYRIFIIRRNQTDRLLNVLANNWKNINRNLYISSDRQTGQATWQIEWIGTLWRMVKYEGRRSYRELKKTESYGMGTPITISATWRCWNHQAGTDYI